MTDERFRVMAFRKTVYLLEKQDKNIRTKVMGLEVHPLHNMLPEVKNTRYQLRRKSAVKPKVNTKRFMSYFVNRLIFKYEFAP